jgi:hypothetical protein
VTDTACSAMISRKQRSSRPKRRRDASACCKGELQVKLCNSPRWKPTVLTLVLLIPLSLSAAWASRSELRDRGDPAPRAAAGQEIRVSSADELLRVLRRARHGAIIRLAPGSYPSLTISGVDIDGNVTITSADSKAPAQIHRLVIRNSSGITVQNLEMIASERNDFRVPFHILSASRMTLDRLHVHGPLQATGQTRVRALLIRGSSQITVSRSRFRQLGYGIALLDVDGLTIKDNEFSDIRTDGLRGGGVSNALIANNVFTDFHPVEGDHPDAIQLWSTNQSKPARNIIIRDNLIVRGNGTPIQGIFIRDTHNQLPFENVQILDNLVVGGRYNGIAVNGVIGGRIEGNEVIAFPDSKSWIRVDDGRQLVMRGNRAPFYVIRGESDVQKSNNDVSSPTNARIAQRIAAWLDAKPGRRRTDSQIQARLVSSALH